MTDDMRLDALRGAFTADDGQAAPGCPTPETLWAGARGELPPEERDALVDHLAICPACSADWRVAADLGHGGNRGGVVTLRRRDTRRILGALTSIAAAGLLVAVGLQWRDRFAGEVTVAERGGEDIPLRSLVEADVLSRDRAVLRWSAVPGATYEVTVRTPPPEMEVVVDAVGLSGTELAIPPAALAALPRGARLHWRVEALLPDGRRIASRTHIVALR
jgi:hypothetical protein